MPFLQLNGVSLAFGDRALLKNCNLFLKAGSRAALCGVNGSGKSTLLNILAGGLEPDSGERVLEKETRLAYLRQSGAVHRGKTLYEESETAFEHIALLAAKADYIGEKLREATRDDARTTALLDEQNALLARVEDSGYAFRKKEIFRTLSGLGFSESGFYRMCEEFSGGWQMRIALAKVLLSKPDILLLDEPTNYLDIEARSWLEKYLADFPGACLVVSHDRYFLDVTVNEVYELFQAKLTRYAGNYSAYKKIREAEISTLISRYEEQQANIAKTEDLIRRFRYKASKAKMVQERIGMLERMERIEIPENLKKITINPPTPARSGKIALTLNGVSKSYGSNRVLEKIDLTVESGERLLVVGPNGVGKSTLLRIIAGADDGKGTSGNVVYGSGIITSYFNPDVAETVTGDETVLEYLESRAENEIFPHIRNMAGAFLFRGDDVYKPVSVLSGGEKSRLELLTVLMTGANLLILDEPTNHLDLDAKDILLDALKRRPGTIIFVSHDRAFMEDLSVRTLELSPDARHKLYYGNYGYYLQRQSGDRNDKSAVPGTEPIPHRREPDSGDNTYFENKRNAALERRRKREEDALIKRIEELEVLISACDEELARSETYTSGEKTRSCLARRDAARAELDRLTALWEGLAR